MGNSRCLFWADKPRLDFVMSKNERQLESDNYWA